jgi:hypothetical protein
MPAYDRCFAREFIELPFQLYRGNSYWVPWFRQDMMLALKRTHPFFRHAEGEFFLVRKNGKPAGRLMVAHNRIYNTQHGIESVHFYFFDTIEDPQVPALLFDAAASWAREREQCTLLGPMLYGGASGTGLLVRGFEERAAMTMMRYNYPYYPQFLENLGFKKALDLHSAHLNPAVFKLPAKVHSVAEKVMKRNNFKVLRFRNKAELAAISSKIAGMYRDVLGHHMEAYELTDAELAHVTKELLSIADPDLIKIITYGDEPAGFLFAFPDISPALQKAKGRLTPWNILRLLREFKKTDALVVNGAGIRSEFQRLGGNALLYSELEKTVRSRNFRRADLAQVAETTELMLDDLVTLGADIYKTHRIYRKDVA